MAKNLYKNPGRTRKLSANMLAVIMLLIFTVGGTVAFLAVRSAAVKNTFVPSHVSCEVEEKFDGTYKSDVKVKNTSDINAYIRVRLVTYRVNAAGDHIGGTATVPSFTPGTGWFFNDGYYYHKAPVNPGYKTRTLIDKIELNSYDDTDGGKQVIEVIAEAIQADGTDTNGTPAVTLAWKVYVDSDKNLTATNPTV